MRSSSISEIARTVVRRNTEEVQGGGNFEPFEELFADDFIDHTPQPNMTPDKAGARGLYLALRSAFPDFHAEIHWQTADGEIVTTYKTYYGTHKGTFLGIAPTLARSTSRPSMPCECITARSPSIGVWQIFFP
jgi:SnoaL-like polyketide cyclase